MIGWRGCSRYVSEDFIEAFKQNLDTMLCSDGRVLYGNKIGFAGPLVLASKEDVDNFVEKNKGKIKKVTAHADCGAAGIAFNKLRPEEIPEGISNSDEYGVYIAKKLAKRLGDNENDVEFQYLDRDDMAKEYHNETAIVLDQTGRFNSTNLPGFPAHFVCSGAGFGVSKDYMKAEMKILAGIAMGSHGFGDRFDVKQEKKNPFYILVAANDEEQLNDWMKVAEEVSVDFEKRIIVKGFIAPVKE